MAVEEIPSWKQPSHPDTILVEKGAGSFSQHAESLRSLPAGAVITSLAAAKPAKRKTYATVQVAEDAEIDLNSDVLYFNHSCKPSAVLDTAKMEVRVADERPLAQGDELTLFYPSFEWKMEQPFDCYCGHPECVGRVAGAANLDRSTLARYWLNDHIQQLLKKSAPT